MATLMKLHIAGIRSFGPYEEQTQQLKFTTPVTLILGQNGCGKTTIIESIKYACSGEVPAGTNNGQGFVNDPKMTRMSATKGQIKLKFLDPKNNEVTVSRVVEVTQTATAMKFNSKSSTLRIVSSAGNDRSISGRCADITSECCQLMNVSSAVLNNVIFCHQENSSWPLDEGKKLKEKFDDIFDAQKYNKCTDLFRAHLKTKQNQLKVLNEQLLYRKEKKDHADKMNRDLQDKQDKLDGFETDIKTNEDQLNTVKTRLDEIIKLEENLCELNEKLTDKKARKNGIIEEQRTIRNNLAFEFEGDDEDLRRTIASFESDRGRQQTLIENLETRKTEVEDKNKVIAVAIQDAQTQLGKLNEQKNQYEQKCAKRTTLIANGKTKLRLESLKGFEDNDGAKAALLELKSELENQDLCLAVLIEEQDEEQKNLQDAIDKARDKTVTTAQNKTSKEEELQACENKLQEITDELSVFLTSDTMLEDLKKRIENIDRSVNNLNKTFKEKEESNKLEEYKRTIQNLERTLEDLDKEYRILQQNDVIEGKMESERRLVMEKQKEINRIRTKHSNNFKQLFQGSIPDKNFKESVLAIQKSSDLSVKNLTNEITKTQKEVTTLEVQRNNQHEKVASCEAEIKKNRDKISQACHGRNFTETLNSTLDKKQKLQIDKGQYNSIRIIYGKYIKEFEAESPCCPVCETDFSRKTNIVQKIIATLKNKLETVPAKLERVEKELEKEEAYYEKLQQLKFVDEETDALENEQLPQLKDTLKKIEQELNVNLTKLNELKAKLIEPQTLLEISNKTISDVGSLDQNLSDVDKSQRNISTLKAGLVQVASNKSKQEVEAEIDTTKIEINELRGKVDSITKNINNHKDRMQDLMQTRKILVEKQVSLKENIQSQPLLEAQQTELAEKVTALKEEINKLKLQLITQKEELRNAIETKRKTTETNKQQLDRQRNEIKSYYEIVQDIEKLQKEIDDYLRDNLDEKLRTTESNLKEYKDKESALELTKTKIINAISEKKENLAKEELRFRTLQSNVVLREKKKLETKFESEIEDLKRQIGGFNFRTVYEEKQNLEKNRRTIEGNINRLQGERNALQNIIVELRREINIPENKKAYANYMAKLYEIRIVEQVNKDLLNYINALDKAVLEFHRSKMVQINRTIRHLWRNTYRGNDIDHIEIKTEHVTSTQRKRSYNYKVVQIKKGIELEMRGRCSAGQKVLACLIIRMALAETLSSNCGILALDEPTTNLDRANILSLSDTLARIINDRHKEKSFQLVVITHDEEFLNALTRAQGVSYFYRVERDKDGFSLIKKQYVL